MKKMDISVEFWGKILQKKLNKSCFQETSPPAKPTVTFVGLNHALIKVHRSGRPYVVSIDSSFHGVFFWRCFRWKFCRKSWKNPYFGCFQHHGRNGMVELIFFIRWWNFLRPVTKRQVGNLFRFFFGSYLPQKIVTVDFLSSFWEILRKLTGFSDCQKLRSYMFQKAGQTTWWSLDWCLEVCKRHFVEDLAGKICRKLAFLRINVHLFFRCFYCFL